MTKNISLKRNAVLNVILTVSNFIFPLITFPYVSRVLQPDGIGRVSFANSVISYFVMFASLGIPTYGIRECAKVRDDKEKLTRTVQELLCINLLMTALMYVVFFIALFNVSEFKNEKTLFIVMSTALFFNCVGVEWLYQGLERYAYITIRSLVFKTISLVCIFMMIHSPNDYIIYGGLSVFSTYASKFLNFINLRKIIDLIPRKNLNLNRHMKYILVFFAMSCATTVYTNLDTTMLGFMTTKTEVGYYDVAVKIKGILVGIVTSLGVVLLPRSSYYIEHDQKDEFLRLTKKAMNFVLLVAVPLTVYFIIFAKESIFVLSGDAYTGSIVPMQLILPTVLFIGMSNITGIQILVPLGKEKIVLYSEIIGGVIDFLINWMLIPTMGASGAAIGTLVAEILVWIYQYMILNKEIKHIYMKQELKIIIAVMISSLSVLWVPAIHLGNFMTLVVSAICFFCVYAVVLLILKEPMMIEMKERVVLKIKH
jgi:O-antigen/teichoic acid export membrane protein